jgi:hypothetical protein
MRGLKTPSFSVYGRITMRYHLEIDALNALVAEVRKTNELLEKLLERGTENVLHENEESVHEHSVGRKRRIRDGSDSNGDVQPAKRTYHRRSRRDVGV